MVEHTSFLRVFALWAAGLGAAAQYAKISVIFDLLPDLYPEAGPALGFLVSLVGGVGILFGVVAGLMVARIRYRRALLFALWLGAAVSVFQALLPGFGWMLASRVVEGLSHLAIVVAAPTLIAQLSTIKDRGFTLTLWGTFFGVAFAILTLAGRPLALTWGVPALFAAHALYMAGCALVLSATLRSLPEEGAQPPFSLSQIWRDHLAIYRSPFLSAPAAGWLFYTFSFVSILTVLPPYLPEGWRAITMAAMPLTSIAVSLTIGVALLRRFPAVRVVQAGFALSALSMVWLWLSPGFPLPCLALERADRAKPALFGPRSGDGVDPRGKLLCGGTAKPWPRRSGASEWRCGADGQPRQQPGHAGHGFWPCDIWGGRTAAVSGRGIRFGACGASPPWCGAASQDSRSCLVLIFPLENTASAPMYKSLRGACHG